MFKRPDNKIFGLINLSVSIILTVIFFYSRALELLTDKFFDVFFPLTIGVTLILALINWMESQSNLSKIFFFNELVPQLRFGRNPLFRVGLHVVASIVFVLGVFGLGSAIIDLPQPFTQSALSVVGDLTKIYYTSVIPGFFEEASIFILITAIRFIAMVILPRKLAIKLFFPILFLSVAFGSGILTMAHSVAYGSDQSAYIGIFAFEFIVQSINQITGLFLSWLPHMLHNAIVTLNFYSIIAFGGTQLAILVPIYLNRRNNK